MYSKPKKPPGTKPGRLFKIDYRLNLRASFGGANQPLPTLTNRQLSPIPAKAITRY